MSETKERQWAVLQLATNKTITRIVWFDARETARTYVRDKKTMYKRKGRRLVLKVLPMTRGPHS